MGLDEPYAPPRAPFALPLTVEPADVDAQGHASNVSVLGWMNRAAIAHAESLGWDYQAFVGAGGCFVVRRHELEYLAPALPGEALIALTWPCARSRLGAERRHEVRRQVDQKLLARGWNHWVWVDLRGRPARLPEAVAESFDPRKFM